LEKEKKDKMTSMNYLVLGIGQSLRGDDAAGLEAVRLWQQRFPGSAARVRVEIHELPGVGLLDMLEGVVAAVIVDAVKSKAPAGTLMRLGQEELASFEPGTGSAHGWGVAETLHLGYQLYPELANCQITLIGIVGGQFDMGEVLSPNVRKVLPKAAQLIENEVEKWS
jgi:hydrogenase maturation protease